MMSQSSLGGCNQLPVLVVISSPSYYHPDKSYTVVCYPSWQVQHCGMLSILTSPILWYVIHPDKSNTVVCYRPYIVLSNTTHSADNGLFVSSVLYWPLQHHPFCRQWSVCVIRPILSSPIPPILLEIMVWALYVRSNIVILCLSSCQVRHCDYVPFIMSGPTLWLCSLHYVRSEVVILCPSVCQVQNCDSVSFIMTGLK